jgi:hexulose-6-phosphate isomerase
MQGRLSPPEEGHFQVFPRATWQEEFELAAHAGLIGIEWIYDSYGKGANPLESDEGIEEIKALSRRYDIGVTSLCADYFMENLLFGDVDKRQKEHIAHLRWLMQRCHRTGIQRIVLPFVDNSSMRDQIARDEVVAILKMLAPEAQAINLELHLETNLAPHEFAAFLMRLPHETIKVNYDTGNSAALGFNIKEEWAAYGTRVGSVHLKDRIVGGGTVPLGEGNVKWDDVFATLSAYKYPLVLQVARGESRDEMQWARHNWEWLEKVAKSYGFESCG